MQNFKIVGDEPVKFVVEMGLGACIEEWFDFANLISDKGGVLLYERFGIGRSISNGSERIPKNIANELFELLKNINHEDKIIIIAHSQGGLYAQQFIRMYPNMVNGVIMIDPLSAKDYLFKEILDEKEYVASGVDKSKNLLLLDKFSKYKLGWLVKKLMKKAPPLYYKDFSKEETKAILNSYVNRVSLKTAYQEYDLAHKKEYLVDLTEKNSFPDIPLILITHNSEYATKESMDFGGNSYEFAAKIETMWQDIMKQYLNFSINSKYVQAKNSGHYIHLTEPNIIVNEVEELIKL